MQRKDKSEPNIFNFDISNIFNWGCLVKPATLK